MDGGDATGQVGETDTVEPDVADFAGKRSLIREPTDAFDQILIGLSVVGDHLADKGQQAKRVGVVNFR